MIFLRFLKVFALRPCCLDRRLRTAVLRYLALTFGFWRAIWARLEAILASFWGRLGPAWGSPSRLPARLGAVLGHRGALLGHLGRSWGHLVAILGDLGAILGDLGAILAGLGAILGRRGLMLASFFLSNDLRL